MAGLPLTAWALRHPWGDDADTVLDRLRQPPVAAEERHSPRPAMAIAVDLLEELDDRCAHACSRWGASRVACVVAGSGSPILSAVREHTAVAGPLYHLVEANGAKVLASADRLLRASLVDAVLAGAVDDGRGALLMLERHGDAFVELWASAEVTGAADEPHPDPAVVQRVVSSVWSAAGRPPLAYVHTQAASPKAVADAGFEAGSEAGSNVGHARSVLPDSVPWISTCVSTSAQAPGDHAIDVVLAAASVSRGFMPGTPPRELEHDRVLVHTSSTGGHHVALLLGARP
ncbi:MAG: hypothetical protein AAGF11_08390 [Myxococcota bacterium]